MLRKHRRFAVDLETADGELRVKDISFGGMRVLSNVQLYVNDLVRCELPTRQGVIPLEGRVTWAQRSGREDYTISYGVGFETPTGRASLRIRQLLYDLAEAGAEKKEGPIDPLDMDRLRDRIAELESQGSPGGTGRAGAVLNLESVQPALNGDAEAALSATPVDEEDEERRLVTHFDSDRFAHLVRLGQPMLVLKEGAVRRIEGPGLDVVAAAFSSRFDLDHVQDAVGGSLDQEAIVRSLFVYYRRDVIDFA